MIFTTTDPIMGVVIFAMFWYNVTFQTSKFQPMIALFNIEVEYISLSNGVKNITWLRILLKELQFLKDEST
jgi:hypothetical protein